MDALVFKYGACTPSMVQEVEQRLYQGNLYYNSLVEMELNKRRESDSILRKYDPVLFDMENQLVELSSEMEQIEFGIKKLNQTEGKKKRDTRLPELRKKRSELRVQIRARRKELCAIEYNSEVESLQEEYNLLSDGPNSKRRKRLKRELQQAKLQACSGYERELLELKYNTERAIKDLYASSSLFWCHKNDIKDGFDKACAKNPRFHRYRGVGRLYTQIIGGMDSRKRFMRNDWFYVSRVGTWHVAHVRIGTVDRRPLMVEVPIVFHRDLPDDCSIRAVSLVRKRCATKVKWELQVHCASEQFESDAVDNYESVGIDLGWRFVPEAVGLPGGLKVAHIVGSDGQDEEVIIPQSQVERWRQLDKLQAVRDNCYNAILDVLIGWLKSHDIPEWLLDKTSHIHQWKSQNRLAGLVYHWRDNRFKGDESIFKLLDGCKVDYLRRKTRRRFWAGWRNWDKHLYEWQENLRRKAIDWRLNYYRNVAAQLSRKYGQLRMEDVDWSKTMRRSLVEDESNDDIKRNQRIAAPGLFREVLEQRFHSWVRVKSSGTTARCHRCNEWCNIGAAEVWTCACGAVWNRDYNAAYNILHSQEVSRYSSGTMAAETPGLLACCHQRT